MALSRFSCCGPGFGSGMHVLAEVLTLSGRGHEGRREEEDMGDENATLPPVHTWWPYLTIPARHAVLLQLSGPLGDDVLEEIERLTGAAVPRGSALSDADVQFVVAQIESVD
jgi:hypothetical protein